MPNDLLVRPLFCALALTLLFAQLLALALARYICLGTLWRGLLVRLSPPRPRSANRSSRCSTAPS